MTLSVRELKELEIACKEREKIVELSTEAELEVIKAALTSLLPENVHFMITPFLETLVEELAVKVLIPLKKKSIKSFEDAMSFVHYKIFKKDRKFIKDIFILKDGFQYRESSEDALVYKINNEIENHKIEEKKAYESYIKATEQKSLEYHKPRYRPLHK